MKAKVINPRLGEGRIVDVVPNNDDDFFADYKTTDKYPAYFNVEDLSFTDELRWQYPDPKYQYPESLTRIMDEYGDWHYAISEGHLNPECQYISLSALGMLPDSVPKN